MGPLPRVFLRTRTVWPPKALTMRTDAKEVPIAIAALLVLIAIAALPGSAQSNPDLQTFFRLKRVSLV